MRLAAAAVGVRQGKRWGGPGYVVVAVALMAGTISAGVGGVAAGQASPAGAAVHDATPGPWAAEQLPLPSGANRQGSGYAGPIACPQVPDCVVLGEYATAGGADQDFIDTEDGSSWASVRAPLPPGGTQTANFGPYTLRCTGEGDCVGTSVYETDSAVEGEIILEVKGVWSAVTTPMPRNADPTAWPTINASSCPAEGACVMVGSYETQAGYTEGLVVTQVRGAFVAGEATVPGGGNSGSALTSVACRTSGTCVAAGYYFTTGGAEEPLLVHDASGTLAGGTAPLPSGASSSPAAELLSVWCSSASHCVAVGSYRPASGGSFGTIDTGIDGNWSARSMPLPPGASAGNPAPSLYGIVCKSDTDCFGAGKYVDSGGHNQGVALVETNGSWTARMMPGTDAAGPVPKAVACFAVTTCGAGGYYETSAGQAGYLLSLDGTTLSGTRAPLPSDANEDPGAALDSMACPWTYTCVAAGVYSDASDKSLQLPVVVRN